MTSLDLDTIEAGIYFGLDEEAYHRAPWCGSSDIKQLAFFPQDYWANSAMNPLQREPKKPTPAKMFGTALHYGVLYGEDRFRDRYGYLEGDSGEEGPSANGLKDWITQQGGKPAKLKADNERMVWEQFDTILLTEEQFNKVITAHQTIKSNPYLVEAFSKGFPEVSIFWHDDGVPCKLRIDYLKIKTSVDLKSFAARERLATFDQMVIWDIKRYLYHVQADHYTAGRLAAAALLKAGKVFMAYDEHTRKEHQTRPADDWLAKALDNPEPWFTFVFYKTDGANVAKSFQLPFGRSAWKEDAESIRRRGLINYQSFMERFGPTAAWVVTDEPNTLDDDDYNMKRSGF